jgi:glc operon protein GlcG
MPRALLGVLPLFLLVASLGSQPATAQPPQGGPPPQGGGRGGALPATIDLATARKIVASAQAAAMAANARVAIAVVDSNGDLVVLERMDGSGGRSVTSAQGKARAAIVFGKATKEVADAAAAGTALSMTLTPSGAGTGEVTIQQGGIPIMKDGKVVGGVGVGGSSPANDEKFAQAGVESIK